MSASRKFVCFDIAGDLAHFRRPYAISTALTFPIPPRTALCGLVGALLGLPKNENLRYLGDSDAIFGLQLRDRIKTGHVSLNLIDTKGSSGFRPKAENPHTIMRYEVIRDPRYRIWFSHSKLGPDLYETLLASRSHYTPCLGLAWMICWSEGNPVQLDAEYTGTEHGQSPVTLVRSETIDGEIDWDDSSVYQRVRMPAEMQPDRIVTRYQEYVIETTGRSVRATASACWRMSDGTIISPM